MASIRKRDRRWQVQIRVKGAPSKTKTFKKKTDAFAWARTEEKSLRKAVSTAAGPETRLALKDVIYSYIEHTLPLKKSRIVERSVGAILPAD